MSFHLVPSKTDVNSRISLQLGHVSYLRKRPCAYGLASNYILVDGRSKTLGSPGVSVRTLGHLRLLSRFDCDDKKVKVLAEASKL
eukprot:6205469-Pleurochrysis_carterae.AAC.1